MSGPLMSVGFWSATDSELALFDRLMQALEGQGAAVTRYDQRAAHVQDHPCFAPSGETGDIEVLQCAYGSLVEIAWSIGSIDHQPWSAWDAVRRSVVPLITAVRPTLAVVAEESSNEPLPDPDWVQASSLFTAGWVDTQTCTVKQRASFLRLKDAGWAIEIDSGIWWNSWRELSGDASANLPKRRDLAAAVYQAWTGRIAPPAEPGAATSHTAEDMAPRQLWFWSHDHPANELAQRVERAVRPRGLSAYVWDFGQPSPWPFVIARFMPQGRSIAELLDDLRAVVGEVGPSWAGVQPKGGFLMPGPEVEHPAMGMITHPWVSRRWIGSELPRLEEVLAGSHREEIAGGILWVTDPSLAPGTEFTDAWLDEDEHFERLSAAADILGQAARRSLGMER
jgi:hypothetical protein